MTSLGWLHILVFLMAVLGLTPAVGRYLTRVFTVERTWLDPVLRPLERLIYRAAQVDETHDMRWTEYAASVLAFSLVSIVALYALQRMQGWLPLNPEGLPGVPPALAFNTAVSFVTNTNWQAYGGEFTMSYLTQMAGLAWQNFMSAGVGLAVAVAVIRGLAARERPRLGNFWVDLTRTVLWVLLPVSVMGALFLVSQGVVQNLGPYGRMQIVDQGPQATDTAIERIPVTQVLAQGPVASQESIKHLGTNGGGFFNANSAHPFENPTPLTNFFYLLLIFAIPSALTWMLGEMTGSRRHGWAVWATMAALFLAGVSVAYWAESRGNPLFPGVDQQASALQPGGNMEGKEARFGISASALFAATTTAASCGAVNSMHDSFTPLGGLVPLANILLGEVVFGGVGAGLYGIVVFVVLAVFMAGLMVGRTPEYLGKKIEAFDVRMAILAVLVMPLVTLTLSAVASAASFGTSAVSNPGPHGLSQMLYAYASGAGNNGSAFAGLRANTDWYNVTIALAMLVGRFFVIVPTLALAGHLGSKKRVPPSLGTFPVTTPLFALVLASVIVVVGALTFFPVLSLGPIVEHLLLQAGATF